jgi:formylglycine-generating enzyme
MKSMMKLRFAPHLLSLFVIVSFDATCRAEEAKDGLRGISKTKPDSGISVPIDGGFMVPYSETIPGTKVTFEMIPIPGGKFKLGSPGSETGRSEDEGPQVEVEVAPFWMAKNELTWAEYKVYMSLYQIFKRLHSGNIRKVNESNLADAITAPTPLYESGHTFEFGEDPQQPAVTMTQYSAKQYTKLLSGMTGIQYRLPSEAEWEYAARGGSQTAYSFGDDESQLADFACFEGSNTGGPSKVGQKKPNAFGLHDMHGNVWEWTIDAYTDDGFTSIGAGPVSVEKAIQWPTSAYPRCVRGGGWQDPADRCRSAARMGTEDVVWKDKDPNEPLSPWWYTDDPSRSVGMRLARSLKPIDSEQIKVYWNVDNEEIEKDIQLRIDEGRGALGLPVPELAKELAGPR